LEGLRQQPCAQLFLYFFKRRQYGGYYDIIGDRHIDLGLISNRLRSSHYSTPSEVALDIRRLIGNCKEVFPDGSTERMDVEELESAFTALWLDEFGEEP
jgi:hypothetical protein